MGVIALLLAVPVAFGVAGVALPAFGYLPALGGTGFSLDPFRDLITEPGIGRSVLLSFAAGLLTTLVSVGGVMLFIAAFSGGRGFSVVRQLLAPLLAIPHAAAAFGLAFLIAPSGFIFRLAAEPFGLSSPPDLLIIGDPLGLAMMAGLVTKELPFLLLVALAAMPQADPERRLALARSLGYGRIVGSILCVWPGIYRQIRLPILAVAAYASSVVDVALILGPSTPPPLAVRLLQWMSDPDLSYRFQASAGALLQLGVTLGVILSWLGLERVCGAARRALAASGRRWLSVPAAGPLAAASVTFAAGAVFIGLSLLTVWSFAGLWSFPALVPDSFTVSTWTRTLHVAAGPLATTLLIALFSTGIALILVVTLLESRRRNVHTARPGDVRLPSVVAGLLYLPLIIPQVAFVFGLQVLVLNAGFRPSVPLLVAVHLLFVTPYVALALAAPWYALDPRYERLAESLGKPRWRTFLQIRLPMTAAPLTTAFAIGFAVSVGQYLPTVLVGAGRYPTITTEAVALASGGNARAIGAYALLQTILPAIMFAIAGLLPVLMWRHRRAMRG